MMMLSSTSRRLIYFLVVSVFVVGAIGTYVRLNADTSEERIKMSRRIQALKQRVKGDPNDREAIEELRSILNSDWAFARTGACVAMRDLGPIAKPCIDDLIVALNSNDHAVQREAAMALGTVACDTDRAVLPLVKQLDSDWDVGVFAAKSLGRIGANAKAAIPALERVAKGKREWLVEPATKSLAEIREAISKQERDK